MNAFTKHFGGVNESLDDLKKKFPEFNFVEITQVHGDKMVYASDTPHEADAHWSDKNNCALIIKTADCIPLLISHPEYICAIHAGWRGVLNEITVKSLQVLIEKYGEKDKIQIALGPHIQRDSFEISKDLFPKFKYSSEKYNIENYFHTNSHHPDKYFIHLSTLVLGQLKFLGIADTQVRVSRIDTMTNPEYNSYRRTSQQKSQYLAPTAGRNYSFVARRA